MVLLVHSYCAYILTFMLLLVHTMSVYSYGVPCEGILGVVNSSTLKQSFLGVEWLLREKSHD